MPTINDLTYQGMSGPVVREGDPVPTINDLMYGYWSTGSPQDTINDSIYESIVTGVTINDKLFNHWAAASGLTPVEKYSLNDHKYYGLD